MDSKKLILKAAYIAQMQGEHKTHFLNPNAVRINKSLGDAVGLNGIGVHMIYVEPGKSTTEYHKHFYEEECLYVVSGQASANIEGEFHKIASGDFIGFPVDTAAHTIVNDGTETLVCLVIGQRLVHDVADYPLQNKRLYRNGGEWDLVDIPNITKRKTSKPQS
jgi:uncharacterized cupin superfamily protein